MNSPLRATLPPLPQAVCVCACVHRRGGNEEGPTVVATPRPPRRWDRPRRVVRECVGVGVTLIYSMWRTRVCG